MEKKLKENDLDIRFHKKIAGVSTFIYQNVQKTLDVSEFSAELSASRTLRPLEYYLNVPAKQRKTLFLRSIPLYSILLGKSIGKITRDFPIKLLGVIHGQKRWISDLDIMVNTVLSTEKFRDAFEVNEKIMAYIKLLRDEGIHQGILVFKNKHSEELRIALDDDRSIPQNERKIFDQMKMKQGTFREMNFREDVDSTEDSFLTDMANSTIFNNPQCMKLLTKHLQIDEEKDSFLNKQSSAMTESADSLRDKQSFNWSMSMVGDGVRNFREKNFKEAWKCFDQALSFYPDNVEGYVARGALKANRNDLKGATEDFQAALKLNPKHGNGKKYFIETSVSMAKRFESNKQWKDASRCYREVLRVDPMHRESKERYQQLLQILSNKIVAGNSTTDKVSSKVHTSDARKKSSSSSLASSAISDSEESSENEWVEKSNPAKSTSHRQYNERRTNYSATQSKQDKIGESSKRRDSKPAFHPKSDTFVKKLKSFSTEDLQLVSKILQKDSHKSKSDESRSGNRTSNDEKSSHSSHRSKHSSSNARKRSNEHGYENKYKRPKEY